MTENAYLVWSTFFPPFFKLWPTINQLRTILLWIVEANFGEALRLVFSLSSSMLKFHRIKVIIKVNISMSLFKKKKSMMVFVWQTKPKVVAVRNEHIQIFCGSCGGNYNKDEFWIGCDICEWWYHGKCIMMTPTKAETLKHYKCASCSLRRGRL